MTRNLHIAILVWLGLSVLAGCRHETMPESSSEAQQVKSGPVNVAMTLSIKGFGGDNVFTKGDFYEQGNDFVTVNDSLFYDHEKVVKDAGIFLFDATNAFDDDGTGKYKFNPALAEYLTAVKHEYTETLDGARGRIEFKLDKPYESLAVIILANYQLASYTASGASMADIAAHLAAKAAAIDFDPDQDRYHSDGIPMHGWKVFGTLAGLPTGATAEQKAARRLRYYKGMTTPLTECGFKTASELEYYAKEGTGMGIVRDSDHVQMEYALSRLQLRYIPRDKAMSADSVTVNSVKLNVYKDKVRILPQDWLTRTEMPNPYTPFVYDASTEVGSFATGDITFKEISSKSNKSTAFVAYVPEITAAAVAKAISDDPTGFKEPSLVVSVKVKVREKTDGTVVTYTYDRDKITVNDGTNPAKVYKTYGDSGWTSWLRFRTTYARKDKDDNDVAIGTRYSLVRHYSYEWVAIGMNE